MLAHVRAVACFEPQRMQTYPLNFLGVTRGMQGLAVRFRLVRFTVRRSVSGWGIWVSSWTHVSTWRRRRVSPLRVLSLWFLDASPPFWLLHVHRRLPEFNNFRGSGQIPYQPIFFTYQLFYFLFFYLKNKSSTWFDYFKKYSVSNPTT